MCMLVVPWHQTAGRTLWTLVSFISNVKSIKSVTKIKKKIKSLTVSPHYNRIATTFPIWIFFPKHA